VNRKIASISAGFIKLFWSGRLGLPHEPLKQQLRILAVVTVIKGLQALGFASGLALAVAAVASPSFAQGHQDESNPEHISAKRRAAIHDCTASASRYSEFTWGTLQGHTFRQCMADHGERE
jgi:hypothetical protein